MKKHLISFICAGSILLAAIPGISAADKNYDDLIINVKNKLDIPEEYTEFSFENISGKDSRTYYMLSWSSENKNTGSIQVHCRDDGFITQYNNYNRASGIYEGLIMDEDSAKAVAENFILKVNPGIDEIISLERTASSYGGLSFNISAEYYGIEYYKTIGTIMVNSDLTVTSMNMELPDIEQPEDGVSYIDKDKAYNLYMNNIGAVNEYRIYSDGIDYQNEKTFPVYRDKSLCGIDAITGETVKFIDDSVNLILQEAAGATDETASNNKNYSELTEKELAELEKLYSLISVDNVIKMVKDKTGIDIDKQNVSTYKTWADEYIYRFNTENTYISVNAVNGDILNLYASLPDNEDTKLNQYDFNNANECRKLFELIAPESSSKFTENRDYIQNTSDWAKDSDYRITSFKHTVNGVDVANSNAEFSSYKNNGKKIYNISIDNISRFKELEFENPDNFKKVEEIIKPEDIILRYVPTDEGIRVIYMVEPFMKNAVTGIDVNYQNEPETGDASYLYSDIDNHWVKLTAQRMAGVGIGFDGGELKPEKEITYNEFVKIIYRYDKDKKIDEDRLLTRFEAAELVMSRMNIDWLKDLDIYKQPFSDVKENVGAVAVLKGCGIISSDSNTFRPNDIMTRAEALQIAYNMLIYASDKTSYIY